MRIFGGGWRALTCLAVVVASGCGGDEVEQASETDGAVVSNTGGLYILSPKVWKNPIGSGIQGAAVPVCFDRGFYPAGPPNSYVTERAWIRDQVRLTWEASANIELTGWGDCGSINEPGLHVDLNYYNWPLTNGLGTALNSQPSGIQLSPDYGGGWPVEFAGCKAVREFCVRYYAAHEFGHALAFAHEQNRLDTPTSCSSTPQGTLGDQTFGAWDSLSMMNYCAPQTLSLSGGDVGGAQAWYGNKRTSSVSGVGTSGDYVIAYNRIAGTPTEPGPYRRGVSAWDGTTWTHETVSGSITGMSGVPAVAKFASGERLIFARSIDGTLGVSNNTGSGWASWSQLDPQQTVGSPVATTAATLSTTLIHVFFTAANGTLMVKTRTQIGTGSPTWGGTQSLGIAIVGLPSLTSWPIYSHGRIVNTRVDVFVRSVTGTLNQITNLSGTWASAVELGANPIASDPAAVSWGPDRIDVFVRGTDNALYSKSWVGTGWTNYGLNASNPFLGDPVAISRQASMLDVFVRGTDGQGYWKSWNGFQWSNYSPLPTMWVLGNLTPIPISAGSISVIGKASDRNLYKSTWTGTWSAWQPVGWEVL